jgi:hypothetical protein
MEKKMNASRVTRLILSTAACRTSVWLACAWPLLACGGSRLSFDDALGGSEPRLDDELCPLRADRPPPVIQLWSPNHKFHLISIEQCLPALARCEPGFNAEFSWASSDEPIDDIGDGHHQPDVFRANREHVCVRAERQGPKNGRVYRLGVILDDADDRSLETECVVIVDHDQRGALAEDDGALYRLAFDDEDDRGSCDENPATPRDDDPPGTPDEPASPVPDAPDPDEQDPDEPGESDAPD